MNKYWTRIFIAIAIFLLLLFFSNDFGLIDIQKTAVIAAIGIDSAEQENLLDVTIQIAVPDQGGNGKASNLTIRNAKSVNEAITELNRKTGWYPSLVHCKILLLGKKITENNVFDVLNFFLRSEFIDDSCLIAVCETRAEDALHATSPIGELTALAITKVLSSEAQKTGAVSVMNLRDFAKGYYAANTSSYLPIVSVKQEAQSESGSPNNGSSQSAFLPCSIGLNPNNADTYSLVDSEPVPCGNFWSFWNKLFPLKRNPLPICAPCSQQADAASQKGSQNTPNSDIFEASKTMLFYQGKQAAILETDETLAFNLADTSTDYAYGMVDVIQDGKPVTYCLKMKISKKEQKLKVSGNSAILNFHIRANAQVADSDSAQGVIDIAQTARVPEHVLHAAEEKFKKELDAVMQKCADCNSDIFGIILKLYRFYPSRFNDLQENLLQNVKTSYDIQFDTLR